MIRALLSTVTCLATMVVCIASADAQWKQPLRGDDDVDDFCRYADPWESRATQDDAQPERADEYRMQRRSRAQRPVVVRLRAGAAPVVGYDRSSGTLVVSLYRPAEFTEQAAVKLSAGSIEFELAELRAHELRARYEAGTAHLQLTLLPLAWSDDERPLCRDEDGTRVVDGELLEASFVDEVGQTLATLRTKLGRDVTMMRDHRIQGYLDSAMPVVTVSALAPFPHTAAPFEDRAADDVKSTLGATLYGCYLRGLKHNARLQGALVVHLRTGNDASSRVLVDSLHDDETAGCVHGQLDEWLKVQRTVSGEQSLKATIIFKLDELPGL